MSQKVKRGGVWRDASAIYVKKGGVWKPATGAFIKSGGSYKSVSSPLLFVTSNNQIQSGTLSSAGNDQFYTSRNFDTGSSPVKTIVPMLQGGWYLYGTTNQFINAPTNAVLVAAVLENTARTRTVPITFGGSRSYTVTPGSSDIKADPIDISLIEPGMTTLPVGYRGHIKEIWQVPAKGGTLVGCTTAIPAGQQFWTASDNSLGISSIDTPGLFTATGGLPASAGTAVVPTTMLLGTFAASGDIPVWLGIGDSIEQGVGDTQNSYGYGRFQKARTNSGTSAILAGANWAVAGIKLETWLSNPIVSKFMKYATRAHVEMGTNSFGASGTAISVSAYQAVEDQLWALLDAANIPAAKRIRTELGVRTTGAWTLADQSDQTIAGAGWGPGGNIEQFNTNQAGYVGTKFAQLVSSSPFRGANTYKWPAGGTPDGVHPGPTITTALAALDRAAMNAVN